MPVRPWPPLQFTVEYTHEQVADKLDRATGAACRPPGSMTEAIGHPQGFVRFVVCLMNSA